MDEVVTTTAAAAEAARGRRGEARQRGRNGPQHSTTPSPPHIINIQFKKIKNFKTTGPGDLPLGAQGAARQPLRRQRPRRLPRRGGARRRGQVSAALAGCFVMLCRRPPADPPGGDDWQHPRPPPPTPLNNQFAQFQKQIQKQIQNHSKPFKFKFIRRDAFNLVHAAAAASGGLLRVPDVYVNQVRVCIM